MRTKKDFTIYERVRSSGNVGYMLSLGNINGKRKLKSFGTKEAAEAYRDKLIEAEANKNPDTLRQLDKVGRYDVQAALKELENFGATLR